MGVVEAVRGLLWARRRQPDEIVYACALAHERFTPSELLEQATLAEDAGFDAVCCSDHLAPWWTDGQPAPAQSGNAWVWLGAVSQRTSEVSIGSAVTALAHRYNPVVVAQQIATLECLAPGRTFLGVGSGEALNEVPAGMEWPAPGEQIARTEEALSIVSQLLDGASVSFHGRYFSTRGARLYTLPERRPPIYMSAFGERAAEVAGRLADGVWCLADPRTAPGVVQAYRRAAEQAGREPGEIIIQVPASWAPTDEAALEGSREWKATLVDEHYTDPIHEPSQLQRNGEQVSDLAYRTSAIVSSDPSTHVRKLKAIKQLGATAIVVMNASGADPLGAIRTYGDHVLPELRHH